MRAPYFVLSFALASSALAGPPYRKAAVASPHPYASEAGAEILAQGGNAVDAAVATAFVIAVVDPYHSGLGGGGFALVYDAKKKQVRVLDFRETAPAGATREMFLDAQGNVIPKKSTDLGASVGVPGAVAGYLELHRTYGKLSRKAVLAPAIRIAKKGSWVTPKYAFRANHRADCLRQNAEAAKIFLRPDASGVPAAPAVGTQIPQRDLARTLTAISARGETAFYKGAVAKAIVEVVQATGGLITEKDLTSYRPVWREPLWGSYRGHKLATMPPPSAGGLALVQTLGALEQRYPDGVPYREPKAIHYFAEVLRRVYADRNKYLGDPAFVQIDLPRLSSPTYITQLTSGINPEKATPSAQVLAAPADALKGASEAFQERKQTSHLSVVDEAGNAVALTTTVNYYFGSCLVPKGTGVVLNDQMDDFTAKPFVPNIYGLAMGESNAVGPGRRPVSSMTPTLVFQKGSPDRIFMAVGSPGGSTIPTTVIQTLSNVIDHGMNASRAVGQGRVHHQYLPDAIWVDPDGLEPSTARALEAMGHTLRPTEVWGDAELVLVDPQTGVRYGASDPRNEGSPAGID
ncbi:MAG: gamma-glutamyltransferase [Myxococcota bacterium]|nr:gamma-glutamyltransferase [Myxococcota bacterium]